jgi:poly(3-hydroxybutyrate) depolymerase
VGGLAITDNLMASGTVGRGTETFDSHSIEIGRRKRKRPLISAQALESSPHVPDSLCDPRARRPFGLSSVSVKGRPVAAREHTLQRQPFANLIAFSGADGDQPPILVVPPLAGSFPILVRDLVIDLLRHGHRVAVADWFDVRYVPQAAGRFGLEEQIGSVADMIRALGADLHVIGVCQAVVPVLAATAFLAAHEPDRAPRSMILMGGPVDPLANPTGVVHRLRAHPVRWFRENVMEVVPSGWTGAGRFVYPKAAQLTAFAGYVARHWVERRELCWKFLADDGEDPINFPFSTLAWTMMDLPAEFILENIRCVFQERDLVRHSLRFGGEQIDLPAIRATALMTVEAAQDDIAAPGQTYAAHVLCRSIPDRGRRHLRVEACGHFSLFHGRICRTYIVPEIIDFTKHPERC